MGYSPSDKILTQVPGALNMQQISTPAILPSSGFDLLYFKSDNNLYRMTSAGAESQVTSSGSSQLANTVFAGPIAGGSAVATFRALVIADLPAIPYSYLTGTATLITPIIDGVQMPVVARTANYNMALTDFVVLASANPFTVTLPNAATVAINQIYVIKKTDASLTNIITIATTASQTINGSTTTTLNTQNETLKVISDGANWQILERYIPGTPTSFTPTWSNVPTGTQYGYWVRRGRFLHVEANFVPSANGSGSSVVLFTLPSGLTIDSNINDYNNAGSALLSSVWLSTATGYYSGTAFPTSSTQVRFITTLSTTLFLEDLNITTPGTLSIALDIPISGWND